MSASVRRRHVALATERRFAGELIHGRRGTALPRLYKGPRAPLSTHATSCYPHGAPLPRIRPGEASFLISGNSCRRHCLVHSGATRTSPSPLSSPGTPPPSQESIPLFNLDWDSPRAEIHFARRPPSAAKLAAGNSLRPHRPVDHRDDRPGVADPSPPSEPREEPPFAGVDRRSPASVRPKEEGGWGTTGQT